MPLVERDAEVTLVTLVYRSLRWLDFVMDGVERSQQRTRYRWLVVANDATEKVEADERVSVLWHNDDPEAHYIGRVYAAWNEGVKLAPTQWCILLNSDMYASDYAIDELMLAKRRNPQSLPCGLLVESGRIPSGMPEYVAALGTNPQEFQRDNFLALAADLRQRDKLEDGRLFMPVLLDRQQFLDVGGYPPGNIGGVSGDRILFDRYRMAGYRWVTARGSVWYHAQEGEMRWP